MFLSGLRIQMNLIRIRILRFGLIRIRIMFESDFNLYLLPIFLYKLYVTYNYKIVIAQIILINKIHFIHPQKYLFPIIYIILILYIVKQRYIPWKVWISLFFMQERQKAEINIFKKCYEPWWRLNKNPLSCNCLLNSIISCI